MKKMTFVWLLMAALAVLLASGCAKKPAPTATAPTTDAPVISETPMQEDIRGFEERAVTEAPAQDRLLPMSDATSAGLQRIFFDFDQHTLSPQARQILEQNAAFMRANPRVQVRVEGHCDERGSDEYNLALGERRARAARDYLISLGIAPNRLSIISYGEEMPLDPRRNEDAWAKNRRAEFNIVSP